MSHPMLSKCPVCKNDLSVTKLHCNYCETNIEGHFHPCEFCNLDKEMLYFMKTFILAQGNIKEVERTLGISYPTVKSKLNQLISQLDPRPTTDVTRDHYGSKKEILDALSLGKISAQEAADLIENL